MKFIALDDVGWAWLYERAHPILCDDSVGFAAVTEDGRIHAAIVMDSWAPNSCQMHFAIDNPMVIRHGFFETVADFCYNVRGIETIVGLVPADNEKAIKLDKRIGFKEALRIPNGYKDGIDYVVMLMTREDCRWLKQEAA